MTKITLVITEKKVLGATVTCIAQMQREKPEGKYIFSQVKGVQKMTRSLE